MDRPHQRPVAVFDLVKWDDAKELALSPKFQRRRVWPPKARSFLIDTVLHGFPVPKLYMRQHLNVTRAGKPGKTVREVVDGQQRVAAVLDFYKGDLRISRAHHPWAGLRYSDLKKEDQDRFLAYEFSVDLLVGASDADVLNVFARINSHSVPLNAQEKRNAKFYGEFKQVAYALGWDHLEFWKRHGILTDKVIARMREAELTSELLVGMLEGLQDKKKSLDKYYAAWDETFARKNHAKSQFRDAIDLIEELAGDTLSKTKFSRPALFYSLFLAICDLRWGIKQDAVNPKAVAATRASHVQGVLRRLSNIVGMEEPPKSYARFVTASQRQTDNIQPRRIRHRTLVTELTKG
jgi:hypothetical protein